jgi:RimJ/RimL family protein N-acetyltransferase
MMFVRKLLPSEMTQYQDHLLKLSDRDRHMRFGGIVSDEAIMKYVDNINLERGVVKVMHDGDNKVVAAIHVEIFKDGGTAEIGLSVDEAYRGRGLSHDLFKAALRWLQTHKVERAYLMCLRENSPMIHIAKSEGMKLRPEGSEMEAFMDVGNATIFTYWDEVAQEQCAWCEYVNNWTRSIAKAMLPTTFHPYFKLT